jgi:SAM-dependent methyltransferase
MNTIPPNHEHPVDAALLRPKRGLRAWLFAKALAQAGDAHDLLVAPYKRKLLADLHGDVLEIGPGSGVNLSYYAPDVHWIGVEPNPYSHRYLHATAAALGRALDLRTGYTEALPAPDQSMDAVVSTLVLCSVHDLDASLAEIRRVLKPGGKYVFLEHVAAPAGSG